MNEELIKQCARETVGRFTWPHIATAGKAEVAAVDAIRLYHTRHVAPLEQENAELRALVRELTERAKADGERIGRLEANVAPLVEALREITEGAQTTYRARNGRQCSIEADDGELCLIVHSDLIDNGKQALAPFQQEARDAAD